MSDIAEFQYDMGYTPTEFSNVLNGGFSNEKSEFSCRQINKNHWQVSDKNSQMFVEICIQQQPARILGSMSIPVLLVIFKMNSQTQQQTDFFFDKFFKYFHKGGG